MLYFARGRQSKAVFGRITGGTGFRIAARAAKIDIDRRRIVDAKAAASVRGNSA
jgi:hypothetical protein